MPPGSHLSPQGVFLVAWSVFLQTPVMSGEGRIGGKDWCVKDSGVAGASDSGSNTLT